MLKIGHVVVLLLRMLKVGHVVVLLVRNVEDWACSSFVVQYFGRLVL